MTKRQMGTVSHPLEYMQKRRTNKSHTVSTNRPRSATPPTLFYIMYRGLKKAKSLNCELCSSRSIQNQRVRIQKNATFLSQNKLMPGRTNLQANGILVVFVTLSLHYPCCGKAPDHKHQECGVSKKKRTMLIFTLPTYRMLDES